MSWTGILLQGIKLTHKLSKKFYLGIFRSQAKKGRVTYNFLIRKNVRCLDKKKTQALSQKHNNIHQTSIKQTLITAHGSHNRNTTAGHNADFNRSWEIYIQYVDTSIFYLLHLRPGDYMIERDVVEGTERLWESQNTRKTAVKVPSERAA